MPARDLAGRRVLVCGVGVAGASAARALSGLGAQVMLSALTEGPAVAALVAAGARWLGPLTAVPDGTDLVVASPGLRPDRPAARRRRATRASRSGARSSWRGSCARPAAAPWLALTGTNGKTTTVRMLEAILRAAGRRARGGRQRRRAADRRRAGRPALRHARRRAVQPAAALRAVARRRPPARCSTSRPTISTGTARSRPTPRPKRRSGAAEPRSTTPTTRWSPRRAPARRRRLHPRPAGRRAARRGRRAARRPRLRRRRPGRRRPTYARPGATTSRTRWPPRPSRWPTACRPRRSGRACARSCPTRTATSPCSSATA